MHADLTHCPPADHRFPHVIAQLFLLPSSHATRTRARRCDPYVDRSRGPFCDLTNLKPWQSGAQGVVGARTTVYYAMGLPKAGTSLMGAALAARLGGGYQNVCHASLRNVPIRLGSSATITFNASFAPA